jgi:hypothetical protein
VVTLASTERRKRGYTETDRTREVRSEGEVTNLYVSLAAAIGDQVQSIGLTALAGILTARAPQLAPLVALPTMFLAGRAMRGSEAMTHEASHLNITREKQLNDAVGNLTSAWSVFSTVQQFRAAHIKEHHGKFGTVEDPCFSRYEAADVAGVRRDEGGLTFAVDVLDRLPRYYHRWWVAIGSDRSTLWRGLTWHGWRPTGGVKADRRRFRSVILYSGCLAWRMCC